MKLNIVNTSNNPMPAYETKNSAGMDLRAYLPEGPITLEPMQRGLVPTGLYMEIPEGYEGQVRPRSGLALKSGITVLNSPSSTVATASLRWSLPNASKPSPCRWRRLRKPSAAQAVSVTLEKIDKK